MERGKIKWFNDVKGFGFILDKHAREVFVHRKHIQDFRPAMVEDEDEVSYELKIVDDKPQARKVKLLNIAPKKKFGAMAKKFYKDLITKKKPVVLKLHGRKTAEGRILRVEPYFLYLDIGGEELEIRKLDIKYLYMKNDAYLVQNKVRVDSTIRQLGLGPIEQVKDRFRLLWGDLMLHTAQRARLIFYLLEGESMLGMVDWFTKYEIHLKLTPQQSVLLFKHNLFNLRPFKPRD
ncbi:MAG: hypothetical protein A2284_02230 [Deltaproteobacteria bacterium RIFOXYA12_FULL_61_11]|nr:MAG: hypothetical protein A2284_02230 [Deltaproteobacteria bacterium RIFOXYA12_FULL_61_11]